jgi:hypothetical protein
LDVRTIPVQVRTESDIASDAVVFLPFAEPPGAHGLLGRMNDPDRFVPTRTGESIRLLAKRTIRTLSVGFELPEITELSDLGAKAVHLRIHLSEGVLVEGSVAILLPELRERPLDFLNQAEPFFALSTPEGTIVVNKDWVDFVEPAEKP